MTSVPTFTIPGGEQDEPVSPEIKEAARLAYAQGVEKLEELAKLDDPAELQVALTELVEESAAAE